MIINKTIKYINENSVDKIVAAVLKSNKNTANVSWQISQSRTDYQIKTQEIQNRLREYFPELKIDQELIAIEDVPTLKIKKDQKVKIGSIDGVMITLKDPSFEQSIAQASDLIIRNKFKIN